MAKYYSILVAVLLLATVAFAEDSQCTSGCQEKFGTTYTVHVNDKEAPKLDLTKGALTIPVTYAGNCAEHKFTFGSKFDDERDVAFVWAKHDTNGDTCTEPTKTSVVLDVSGETAVLSRRAIYLVLPEGNAYELVPLK